MVAPGRSPKPLTLRRIVPGGALWAPCGKNGTLRAGGQV
jgi:hypothetical protein